IAPIYVIVGHQADAVKRHVEPLGAVAVFNPDYATGDMLFSFKTGIRAAEQDADAILIALGDQPRIRSEVVKQVVEAYQAGGGTIIAPSWNMRRGHPILIDREHWAELLALPADAAPRDVINRHDITYV